MPKLLYLTEWFAPEPTGMNHGLPLARWLGSHGYDVTVVTTFPNYPGGKFYPGYKVKWLQKDSMDGVPVYRVPVLPSHTKSAVRRIVTYCSFAFFSTLIGLPAAGKADAIYVGDPLPTVAIPALIASALYRAPIMFHMADVWPNSITESGFIRNSWLNKLVDRLVSGWCDYLYRKAAAISVLSPGVKRLMIERGVPEHKLHTIYDWIDESTIGYCPRTEMGADEFGLGGTFNVMYAGNLGPMQALEGVVEAAARVKDKNDIRIVIVGTGPKEEDLRRQAEQLGASNVVFLGARPYAEMGRLYSYADVLLVPLKDIPLFVTGIPSKTQVCLASGRPILLSIRGDAADIIREAHAGLTVEPENPEQMARAILEFHAMPTAEREQLGKNGRAFYMDKMSLERGASRVDDILRQILGQKSAVAVASKS